MNLPIVDMSRWTSGTAGDRKEIARMFGRACEEWGFLFVAGHGLEEGLLERLRAVTLRFFDLPIDLKMRVSAASRPGGRGYYRLESKSHARTTGNETAPGDLRETYFSGAEPRQGSANLDPPEARHRAPNVWPEQLPEMGDLWMRYMNQCHKIAADLLCVGALALDLPENWFADKIDRPISNLTAQHYPKLEKPPEPGQVRSGAHTDFGTLTLLMTEDKPGGLQIQSLAGEWLDIRPIHGAFIVNIGDMMARWTNDRWRSTLHRVVNPPIEAGALSRRLSIVYFHTPNHDALVECIPSCMDGSKPAKYEPILAGVHLANKLNRTDSAAAGKSV